MLRAELAREFPAGQHEVAPGGCVLSQLPPGEHARAACVAFADQCLPDARSVSATSVSAWVAACAEFVLEHLRGQERPWSWHVFAAPGAAPRVAPGRCRLIVEGVVEFLKKRQRRLLRLCHRDPTAPNGTDEALLQTCLVSPARGYLSYCDPAMLRTWRRCVARFEGGRVLVDDDRRAPSRAFKKLVEVETRMQRRIATGETCVDLGSSPGSWAYTALERGARVLAVDRSPLRDDLMRNPRLAFVRGDAFRYQPGEPVDWLLCDVIAYPRKTLELLERWLAQRWCKRFCVTIKFRGPDEYAIVDEFKACLEASRAEYELRRLTHNKNEVTAFGSVG